MEKKGLIIGIDYEGDYCQASYYSRRHRRPESIAYGGEKVRYLIPTALCYNHELKDWIIGQPAVDYAAKAGETLYRNFLENIFLGGVCAINGQEYSYTTLLAVFIGKIVELTQTATSVMGVENITINLRRVTQEIKDKIYEAIRLLQLPEENVKLQTCAESFAYYIMNEAPEVREKGAILFDFTKDGFYEKVLTVTKVAKEPMIYISERRHLSDYSLNDMGNGVLMEQMDDRLTSLYEEIIAESRISSVYFTGVGFQDLWFVKTLRRVSEDNRAFKGNNLYAKGACLSGLMRAEGVDKDLGIICAGRTRCTISLAVKHKGEPIILNLSKAPVDWFDGNMKMDLILDEGGTLCFYITSLFGNRHGSFDIDVSPLPKRPRKANRIEVELKFFSEQSCEVTVRDKGFGEMFPASDFSVTQTVDLSPYMI